MVALAYNPRFSGRRITVQGQSGKNVRPYSKNNEVQEDWGIAQVLECLPSKHIP
jgi:hypothetical protein